MEKRGRQTQQNAQACPLPLRHPGAPPFVRAGILQAGNHNGQFFQPERVIICNDPNPAARAICTAIGKPYSKCSFRCASELTVTRPLFSAILCRRIAAGYGSLR